MLLYMIKGAIIYAPCQYFTPLFALSLVLGHSNSDNSDNVQYNLGKSCIASFS